MQTPATSPQLNHAHVGRYFLHARELNDRHPLIAIQKALPGQRVNLWKKERFAADCSPVQLSINPPKPSRPVIADHLSATFPVMSDKLMQIIAPMAQSSVEFIPAILEVSKKDYKVWLLHVLKSHDVLDRKNSDFSMSARNEVITWIDELYLDYNLLAKVKLEDRMLFELEGTAGTYLWHEDLVAEIERSGATGIRFFPAEAFGQDAIFSP